MPSLFDPIQLGAIHALNRVIMAPLTRARNTHDHVPTSLKAEYYRQRASAGLIVAEATGISLQGLGWPYAPGIWTEEQIEAWKPIVEAVHDASGRIIDQLWHEGRVVHPSMPGRGQPMSASATTAPGMEHTYEGKKPSVQARLLRIGRAFISNPDLPYRLVNDLPLARDDAATWYTQGRQGYLDYPAAQRLPG